MVFILKRDPVSQLICDFKSSWLSTWHHSKWLTRSGEILGYFHSIKIAPILADDKSIYFEWVFYLMLCIHAWLRYFIFHMFFTILHEYRLFVCLSCDPHGIPHHHLIIDQFTWWRHQMEAFSALLALCAGNSPVPVNSPYKGQWRGALMFSLICAWINDWVINREAGD